jgi:hypothetical protein
MKMAFSPRLVFGLIFLGVVAGTAHCQPADNGANEWLEVLKADARLKKPMTFNLKGQPGFGEVLELVKKATGVPLYLAESPENAKAVFGGMATSGGPAWQVM